MGEGEIHKCPICGICFIADRTVFRYVSELLLRIDGAKKRFTFKVPLWMSFMEMMLQIYTSSSHIAVVNVVNNQTFCMSFLALILSGI